MEIYTIQKNISHSPRKLRLVADMVRKMRPEQALDILQFTNKAAALDLSKAIKTALSNANGQSGLVFKSIEINEGPKMRRYRMGTAGRGRGRPYKKRLSHIKVVLTDDVAAVVNDMKKETKKIAEEVNNAVMEATVPVEAVEATVETLPVKKAASKKKGETK